MKSLLSVFAALAAVGLVACGGTESMAPPETFGEVSSALTCTAACPSTGTTLSCSGSSCSALDGSHVECNGAYQYCPQDPPTTNCSPDELCEYVEGQSCSYPSQRPCCIPQLPKPSGCMCTFQGTWTCKTWGSGAP
jgi:hypothetical protein